MKIIHVPEIFQPRERYKYPDGNDMTMEEYFYDHVYRDTRTERSYLPIFWTTYHSRNNFGHDEKALRRVENFCKSIREPCFTVSQYDDGVVVDLPKNILSMSAGGQGDIALPLTRYAWNNIERGENKYLASFVGNLKTCAAMSDIRKRMIEELSGKEGFYFYDTSKSFGPFKEIMLQSKFAICPRGYGRTSFRMYEALQMGTVPVYISDYHWLPFEKYVDWNRLAICITPDKMCSLPERLRSYSDDQINEMAKYGKEVWNRYFSYQGFTETIECMLKEGL